MTTIRTFEGRPLTSIEIETIEQAESLAVLREAARTAVSALDALIQVDGGWEEMAQLVADLLIPDGVEAAAA